MSGRGRQYRQHQSHRFMTDLFHVGLIDVNAIDHQTTQAMQSGPAGLSQPQWFASFWQALLAKQGADAVGVMAKAVSFSSALGLAPFQIGRPNISS